MNTVKIEMPYIGKNLSVNSYRLSGRKGTTYSIKSSVKGWMVDLDSKARKFKGKLLNYPLVITVNGKFKDRASEPDLDNLSKVICDTLKVSLAVDDRHFRYRAGKVEYGFTSPILEIEIREEG